jgi:hypothetical protein
MSRCCPVLLLAVGCGGGTPSTSSTPSGPSSEIAMVSPQDSSSNPACDAGNWVPRAQEPPHYIACTANSECAKMVLPGCCSQTHVAIRHDHACGLDLGSECDMICEESDIRPEGARSMRAACVANKCTLVR